MAESANGLGRVTLVEPCESEVDEVETFPILIYPIVGDLLKSSRIAEIIAF